MDETAKETVIIVHGTFAAPKPGASRWYRPAEGMPATEGFIVKLNDALQKRGSAARCWAHCSQGDQGFHWSGENSWVARTRAAAELGNYVLSLRKEGWCCHIVAHSHGGNVVLESLPQIAAALPSSASLGKIVTLGTPFMDTMSPILQRISRHRSFVTGLSRIGLVWLISLPAIFALGWATEPEDAFLSAYILLVFIIVIVLAPVIVIIVYAFLFFRKGQDAKPIFNRAAQVQPKFLSIGSLMDEAWQLLYHMRHCPNPMAVETNLIHYLFSSMQSHISRSRQVARIYEAKSYGDLKLVGKLFLAVTHLMSLLLLPFAAAQVITMIITLDIWFLFLLLFIGVPWFVTILLITRVFGKEFYSAFFAPLRWCAYRVSAIKGIFREIATYVVRSRGWSVILAIAMGLEGYLHPLPLIEQHPSSVPGVRYENMPKRAEQRALARRGEWINRHLHNVAQTFSKLVVTSADITLLLRTIESDQTLVHAAYYTEDECIARIADWIAAKDDVHSNAAIAAGANGDA